MQFPLAVPVPPFAVRKAIPNNQWETILDAWILLTELRIRISQKDDFGECAKTDRFSVSFLSSYFAAHNDPRLHGAGQNNDDNKKARRLRKSVFLLTRRYYLEVTPIPDELLDWKLLGDLSECYHSNSALRELLSEVWNRYEHKASTSVEKGKDEIMQLLQKRGSATAISDLITELRRLTVLASSLPHAGHVLMTGSDYLDSLHDAYKSSLSSSKDVSSIEALRSALAANAYVGLTSLLKASKPNLSLLLDHLFTLKVSSGVGSSTKNSKTPELLSDLVCSTDLLVRIERYLVSAPQKRGQDLVSSLRTYQQEMKHLHHRHQRHKKRKDKGKGPAEETFGGESVLHAHRLSLITQIQELFPDLGAGYVLRLLDFYNEDMEAIIAHLLEDSLANELKSFDKSEPLPDTHIAHDVMEPHSTPPEYFENPNFIRNIDIKEDEIIQAARSKPGEGGKKLHFGRANADSTADSILADRSQHATNKAAILSALATFDSDDDERDDTYDVADVGGTVDTVVTGTDDAEGEREKRNRAEETDVALYRIWKSSPAQFARDSATRRSQMRTALKRETGMTDEAIEGWALMLQRDPKKQSRLESRLALAGSSSGQEARAASQPDLPSTAYRKPKVDGNAEDEDGTSDADRSVGNMRGRGRGGPLSRGRGGPNRGGRGGGRGRGANHRRRDQHAKKMAKAGALPT
ncbi:hypothetical protein BGW36DRAFT_369020 [Talaromyces proteolyticus]|uniref:CUE domain-containing protein n=1 Tax=Talaromyces proteolyticus TaxID=1131652 RepID=A0AAD4KZ23_9EURO|nr:uncharacterized protein BGW36DRAFT_369020 [Talaromyces proteolyticus]KAH8703238.1 hypothetical protein BGW36DRAFT_369020 [Talaromyces proteolyticus]